MVSLSSIEPVDNLLLGECFELIYNIALCANLEYNSIVVDVKFFGCNVSITEQIREIECGLNMVSSVALGIS